MYTGYQSGLRGITGDPSDQALGLRQGLGPGQEVKARGEADPATRATAATLKSAQLMGTS